MIRYTAAYSEPNKQYIPITANFDHDGSDTVELQFPAWRPGRYELGDFAKNIHSFRVADENNKALNFKKLNKDRWTVEASGAKEIRVSYRYYAAELNAGSTFMDDQQLYMNPVNCMVYIDSRQNEACQLELDIPDSFEIACGARVDGKTIQAADYHELVDSPLIASSNMQHKTYEVNGIPFHLWFQGEVELDWDRIIKDFTAFTRDQLQKFEGFPVKEYHFLFQILGIKAYHGVEHQTSTVCSLGPGKALMKELYDDFLGVSSHELYHTWNVKAIRPIEMFPYDYSKENYTELGYVAEGVTTYMGDLYLASSNVKDFNWFKTELEKWLQRHFDNFGRFNYSVAESSWDTWLDGYVAGAPHRKVSIYNEGALLNLSTDLRIRANTENRASLHDVMKELYEEFAQKGKGYSVVDYQQICSKLAQEDLSTYFDNYYHSTKGFETILTESFAHAGLEIKMQENPSLDQHLLGIKTLVIDLKTFVFGMYPGGSAELGGIMLKDEIISINGHGIQQNLEEKLKYFKDEELTIKVNRMGRILEITLPYTNKSHYPIYKIKKVKTPSKLNKRIFKSWCGYDWDSIEA